MNRLTHVSLLLAAMCLLAACSTVVVEPAGGASKRPAATATTRSPAPGGSYAVVKGDTLYSIAFRKGVDYRDLARWNGIAAPYTIWPGQSLRLSPPSGNAPVAVAKVIPVAAPPTAAAPVFENVTPPVATSATPVTAHAAPTVAAVHPAPAHVPTPAPASSTVVPVAGESKPAIVPPPAPAVVDAHARAAGGINWRWPADGQVLARFTPGAAVPGIEIAGKDGDPVRAAADGVVVYSGNGLVGYGELVIIKHSDSLLSAYGHNSKRLVKEGQRVSAGQEIARMGSSGATRVELGFQIRKDGNPVDPLNYLPAK